jgi:hypothetical protein
VRQKKGVCVCGRERVEGREKETDPLLLKERADRERETEEGGLCVRVKGRE